MTGGLSVAEVMGALSLAVDLGLGQPMEHGLRTTLLASSLAEAMGLDPEDKGAVYDVSLLRFIGCNAERQVVASYFGDEVSFARRIGPYAQGSTSEIMRSVLGSAGAGRSVPGRIAAAASIVANMKRFEEVDRAHCEVAALLAERMGFGRRMLETLQHGFDRWDGKEGIADGDDIPIEIRVSAVAHDAEIFHRLDGPEGAIGVVERRAGKALDPGICRTFLEGAGDLLALLDAESVWSEVMAVDSRGGQPLPDERIEEVLRTCSDFADMISPYLAGHSARVARLAEAAGASCGIGADESRRVKLAAFVHEVGRAGVSVGVWDKKGSFTESDREAVRLYPYYTERTLARSPFLDDLASIASLSQERLDGSGYHKGVPAALLPVGARLLAASDVYVALTSERAHRPAMSSSEAAHSLREEVTAGRLDGRAVEAVLEASGQRGRRRSREWPRGLTAREVEVLRLIALGRTTKAIAGELVISNKTVENHIQHIYEKLNVTTRSGAAMFAIQQDLVEIPSAER